MKVLAEGQQSDPISVPDFRFELRNPKNKYNIKIKT